MAFTPDELSAVVKEALNVSSSIPPGSKGAFVTVADQDGVTAVIADKISGTWAVTGYVSHPWAGGLTYGATIQATW